MGRYPLASRMANILIVEDDRASARLLSLLLKKAGHVVSEAETLAAARERIFDWPEFALVILDNRIGSRYGWELLQEIRKHFYYKKLPVLVYTAAGDRNSVSRYVQLGVQNIRTKPYAWDVLAVEIEKAEKTAWNGDDFAPVRQVVERLQVTEKEYYAGLADIEKQLKSTAEALLTLLSPSKEADFISLLNELRSSAQNYGVQIVLHIIKEIVTAFREGEWVESVAAVRMLDMVARRIHHRLEQRARELTTAQSAESGSPVPTLPPAEAIPPGRARLHEEVPEVFYDLAASFAQSETVSHLVQRAVHGNVRESRWANHRMALGRGLRWLCYLEPNDTEAVARAIRQTDGLESPLREYPLVGNREPVKSLNEFIVKWGVFQAGLAALTFSWMSQLRAASFPLPMGALATRQLVAAQLARAIASRIQRPINLEATVALEFFGEWLFALRFPGVYCMTLLEETNEVALRYRPAFESTLRPLIPELQLPSEFLEAWHTRDLSQYRGKGDVRLALGIRALATMVCEAYEGERLGHSVATVRQDFLKSPAWELLAAESLKLPDDRARFFARLLEMVAVFHPRAELLVREADDASLRGFTPASAVSPAP